MTAVSRCPRILVADDQGDVLEALKLLLRGEGYEIETAGYQVPSQGITRLEK